MKWIAWFKAHRVLLMVAVLLAAVVAVAVSPYGLRLRLHKLLD